LLVIEPTHGGRAMGNGILVEHCHLNKVVFTEGGPG